MYGYFKGIIDEKYTDRVIIDVNNIGYEIYLPENDIIDIKISDKMKIFTYLVVREDDMKLFGFTTKEKLEFFKKLISVSGVGPKVAIGIISNISVSDMCLAIITDNIAALKKVPGIGPKMAQKIIFELKDKISKSEEVTMLSQVNTGSIDKQNVNVVEAVSALEVLGFSKKDIEIAIKAIDTSNLSVENIIKLLLKELQK